MESNSRVSRRILALLAARHSHQRGLFEKKQKGRETGAGSRQRPQRLKAASHTASDGASTYHCSSPRLGSTYQYRPGSGLSPYPITMHLWEKEGENHLPGTTRRHRAVAGLRTSEQSVGLWKDDLARRVKQFYSGRRDRAAAAEGEQTAMLPLTLVTSILTSQKSAAVATALVSPYLLFLPARMSCNHRASAVLGRVIQLVFGLN